MIRDKDLEIRIKTFLVKWIRRLYVIIFNIYAWYWLYRAVFVRHSSDFEEYLLWFFATTGMYFFVLDGKDVFLKEMNNVKDIDNE